MIADVSIIIVNWNGMKFLPDCLESLAHNAGQYDVIVVDNVSTDGSREWLVSEEAAGIFSEGTLKVILGDANVGFGRANNLAIEESQSEYVFVLNPDTIVKPGAVDRLIEVLESDATIGAVSPKLLNADGTLQPSVAPFPPTPLSIIAQAFGLPRVLPSSLRRSYYGEFWGHGETCEVPVFWGTAILTRRNMIDEIGAFDEDFFMYGEDVEWCARMNRNGWKTVFVHDAEIIHLGGKSSEQAWKASETTLRKDAADILVQEKCLSSWNVAANAITKIAVYSLAYGKRTFLGKEAAFLKEHIALQWQAVKHAFTHPKN